MQGITWTRKSEVKGNSENAGGTMPTSLPIQDVNMKKGGSISIWLGETRECGAQTIGSNRVSMASLIEIGGKTNQELY